MNFWKVSNQNVIFFENIAYKIFLCCSCRMLHLWLSFHYCSHFHERKPEMLLNCEFIYLTIYECFWMKNNQQHLILGLFSGPSKVLWNQPAVIWNQSNANQSAHQQFCQVTPEELTYRAYLQGLSTGFSTNHLAIHLHGLHQLMSWQWCRPSTNAPMETSKGFFCHCADPFFFSSFLTNFQISMHQNPPWMCPKCFMLIFVHCIYICYLCIPFPLIVKEIFEQCASLPFLFFISHQTPLRILSVLLFFRFHSHSRHV